jgi:hypothetical protein
MAPSVQKYTIPLLLIVWFWVWGICPWNSSAAADTVEAARSGHHHGVDETHHASKGTEHSCTGAISFTQTHQEKALFDLRHAGFAFRDLPLLIAAGPCPTRLLKGVRPLFERSTLPKRLTEYYQLYSVYRI